MMMMMMIRRRRRKDVHPIPSSIFHSSDAELGDSLLLSLPLLSDLGCDLLGVHHLVVGLLLLLIEEPSSSLLGRLEARRQIGQSAAVLGLLL